MAADTVRARAAVAAAGLVLAVAVTGCTSSESKSSASAAQTSVGSLPQAGSAATVSAAASAAASAAGTSAAAASGAAASSAPSAVAGGSAAPAAATSAAAGASAAANNGLLEGRPAFQSDPTAGRSIIYTARVDLQAQTAADVAKAAQKAADDADAVNGYVFSRSGQAADNTAPTAAGQSPAPQENATADLVLKVPPGDPYDQVLNQIEKLGSKLLDINEKTSDVTDQMVDTTARLAAQKASVARVRALLSKATTIGQIVQVEGELTRREADLESLEGTLNVLKSQTSLATISVHIEQAPPAPTATPTPKATVPPKPKKHIHGFGGGVKAGSHSFVTGAVGVATVLGALLPYLALGLVLAIIGWLLRRSWLKARRDRRPVEHATP